MLRPGRRPSWTITRGDEPAASGTPYRLAPFLPAARPLSRRPLSQFRPSVRHVTRDMPAIDPDEKWEEVYCPGHGKIVLGLPWSRDVAVIRQRGSTATFAGLLLVGHLSLRPETAAFYLLTIKASRISMRRIFDLLKSSICSITAVCIMQGKNRMRGIS
jgi:hypothetical protein